MRDIKARSRRHSVLWILPLFLLLATPDGWAQSGFWSTRTKTDSSQTEETPPVPAVNLFDGNLPIDVGGVPDGLANITAQGCNACHFQAHDDWATSSHAQTGQSRTFRAALERAGNSTACSQCHLPLSVQHAQLSAGYIDGDLSRPKLLPNPAWDATLMAEGVGCAACHVRDDVVVGTRPISGAPHPVAVSNELGQSELCATCHQLSFPDSDRPFYDTYGEWKATPYAAAGLQCQDCHMPPVAGVTTATRFAATPSHTFTADIARALTVLVDMESPVIQRGTDIRANIRVQNTGAGHHVPTGSPYKAYTITVSLVDDNDVELAPAHTELLGRTVTSEPPYTTTSDNRIPAGGEHDFTAQFNVAHHKKAGRIHLIVKVGTAEDAPTLQSIPLELL